jgi:hypothetical protein
MRKLAAIAAATGALAIGSIAVAPVSEAHGNGYGCPTGPFGFLHFCPDGVYFGPPEWGPPPPSYYYGPPPMYYEPGYCGCG